MIRTKKVFVSFVMIVNLLVGIPFAPVLAEESVSAQTPVADTAVSTETPTITTFDTTPLDSVLAISPVVTAVEPAITPLDIPIAPTDTPTDPLTTEPLVKEKTEKSPKSAKLTSADSLTAMAASTASTVPGMTAGEFSGTQSLERAQFQNDKLSGALVFSYPIDTPPGRNGQKPNVSLNYNSQHLGNGIVGFGWTLSVPYIERLNKGGIDKLYTDGTYTSSEDGELGRLFNTDSYTVPNRADVGFKKYKLSTTDTGSIWVVSSNDGTKYFYGMDSSSRIENPADTSLVYKWMLTQVLDTNGNTIDYTYDKIGNQLYPKTITYSQNGNQGYTHSVSFNYDPSERTTSYASGFLVETTQRLSNISVVFDGSWIRRYNLAYTQDPFNQRSRLTSVVMQGQSDNGIITVSPATTFEYQKNLTGPLFVPDTITDRFPVRTDGAVFGDVNGDGLVDMIFSGCYNSSETCSKKVYINNGTHFVYDSAWILPNDYNNLLWYNNGYYDRQYRLTDFTGDLLPDIVSRSFNNIETAEKGLVYINWNEDKNWVKNSTLFSLPQEYFDSFQRDLGQRFVDFNGDGLTDTLYSQNSYTTGDPGQIQIQSYENLGAWTVSQATVPTQTSVGGVYFSDMNGDGLADFVKSYAGTKEISLSTGMSSGFLNTAGIDMSNVGDFRKDDGTALYRFGDINNDGLDDAFLPSWEADQKTLILGKNTFTNAGPDWKVVGGQGSDTSEARLFIDINGDGAVDSVLVRADGTNDTYINQSKNPELLTKITYPEGGNTSISYTKTNVPVDGVLKNPKLPISMNLIDSITTSDGFGNSQIVSYQYEGAEILNMAAPNGRTFAGFSVVTETTPTSVIKTYYHQGNATNSDLGEYEDRYEKAGKIYRTEVYDLLGNLYSKTVNKWDSFPVTLGHFLQLMRTTAMVYDGNSSHRDTVNEYLYNNTGGILYQKIEYGEVYGINDGSFFDIGSDSFITNYSYVEDISADIFGLLSQQTVTDQSGIKVKESRYYYDTLYQGSVSKGNLTKQEDWVSGTTYINSQKSYDSYGNVLTQTDPRGKVTTYVYDGYNLYPATVKNSLNQTNQYLYNYSNGKPKQKTDANSRVFQYVYDGLGRLTEEKQPDLTTPTTLVTKTAYTYTDDSLANRVKRSDYLDASTTVDSLVYFDGLGRKIQERKESEGTNFAVRDFVYDNRGMMLKESLPYFNTGENRTTATSDTNLYNTYTYDTLGRVLTSTNSVGTTANAYDDWKVTTTDAKGKQKDLTKDVYGNLIQVDEHNGAELYTTAYQYNYLGNLTKITDALANVRNFTYDNLGRRLTAEDLHTTDDTTFGVWNYFYDEASNLTKTIDPKNQTVNYTYDDLNRPLTEDYIGQTGTETTYKYDTGIDGIGRIASSVWTGGATTTYAYNALGGIKTETKTISNLPYSTSYIYDRQGNQTLITYPDNSQVQYIYNSAGLLDKVQKKEISDVAFVNVVSNFDYGPHGMVTIQTNANGTINTNTYDATKLYRLTNKLTTLPNGTRVQNISYIYDPVGNITKITDTSVTSAAKTVDYTYDDLSRLLTATASVASSTPYAYVYSYNAIGNILSSPLGIYTYAGTNYSNPHAVTSVFGLSQTSSDIYSTSTPVLTNTSNSITNTYAVGPVVKTWAHTVTNASSTIVLTADILQRVAGVGSITSATWNGAPFIKASSTVKTNMSSEIWYLTATTTGAKTLSVTVTGATDSIKLSASTFTGIAKSASLDKIASARGTSTNPSLITPITTANELVMTTLSRYSTANANTNKTQTYKDVTGVIFGASSYTIAPVGNSVNTYTDTVSQNWSMMSASFKPNVAIISTPSTSTPALTNTSNNISNVYAVGPVVKTWAHTATNIGSTIVLTADILQRVAGIGSITSVKWNGAPFTKATSTVKTNMSSEIWYLTATTTGSKTLSVTVTGATDSIKLSASTFTGITKTAPLDKVTSARGTIANPSLITPITIANEAVITTLSRYTTTDSNTNKTQIYKDVTGSTLGASSYTIAPIGNSINTYTDVTNQNWAMLSVAFKPIVTTSGTSTPTLFSSTSNITNTYSGPTTKLFSLSSASSLVAPYTTFILTADIQQSIAGTGSITSATWGGKSFTKASSTVRTNMSSEIWYLTVPISGSSQKSSVSVVINGDTDSIKLSVGVWTGIAVTSPVDKIASALGSSVNPSITIPITTANDVVITTLSRDDTADATTNKTQIYKDITGIMLGSSSYTIAPIGNSINTYSDTLAGQNWSMVSASFKPLVVMVNTLATSTPVLTNSSSNATSTYAVGPVTKTWAHTVTNASSTIVLTADILQRVAGVGSITSATWNGAPFTKASSTVKTNMSSEIWYLTATTTGAKTLSVTVTGATDSIKLSASTFTGITKTAPLDKVTSARGTTANPSLATPITTDNEAVITTLSRYSTANANTNKTQIYKDVTGTTFGASSYTIAPIGNSINTYTDVAVNQNWAMLSVSFKPMVILASTSTTANATTTILYDNNGNTTQSGSDVYTWNYRNQMTKATRGTAISTYSYDENGNRIVLTENSITTYFPNRYYSKIGTTGTTTKHIFANGNLVATIEKGNATSTIHYVHTDHLGGTNVITNNVGTVEEVIDYLPYGTIRVDEKIGGFSEKRKYAGTENDTLSGLNYMMARYQNAGQGRFISQDPVFWGKQNLANPQSFNSYSYAENNPINLKDPTGQAASLSELLKSLTSLLKSLMSALGGGSGNVSTQSSQKMTPSKANVSVKNPTTQDYNAKFAAVEETLVGKPYVPYGNGPDTVDCSGAVIYGIRKSANPNFGDYSADDLYKNYSTPTNSRGRGSLTYYDYTSDGKIDHVTTNVGNNLMVNPLNINTGVILTSTSYLDSYTKRQGGSMYYMQLNWTKINQ